MSVWGSGFHGTKLLTMRSQSAVRPTATTTVTTTENVQVSLADTPQNSLESSRVTSKAVVEADQNSRDCRVSL